ncbi:MAG: hypothetical protein J0M22_07070 [Gammaproteobacteria bacterium]|nr:hypothetical protein [Gammaproteobacteria bacterium]
MQHLKFIWWLLLLVVGNCSHALEVQRTVIDDALPNVGIYSIVQDQTGYIWLASTNTGVLRYDGYQFKPFFTKHAERQKRPDIDAMVFDATGKLWTGSWGYALSRVDIASGEQQLFLAGNQSNQLFSPFVQTLFEDSHQRLWIGTDEGLNRYTQKAGMERVFGSEQLINARIWSVVETSDQSIWFGTSYGVYQIRPDGSLSAPLLPHGANNRANEIRSLAVQGDILWIGTRESLFAYNLKSQSLNAISYFGESNFPIINTIIPSQNNQLLVGTFNGISVVDTEMLQTRYIGGQKSILDGVNVRSMLLDRSGLLWAGTREKGLFRTRLQFEQFNDWPDPLFMDWQQQQNKAALSFVWQQDRLFVGQFDQISWGKPASGKLEFQQLIGARVNAVVVDNEQKVWLGADNGIWYFDVKTNSFVKDNHILSKAGIFTQNVRDIELLPNGLIAFGLWSDGVYIYNPKTTEGFRILSDLAAKLTGDAIQDVTLLGDSLWIAARLSGVYRYDLVLNQLHEIQQQVPQLSLGALCLAKGPKQSLLICSGDGLLRYQPESNEIIHYGTADGLPDSHLLSAFTDPNERIWVTSTRGISVLPEHQLMFVTFTQADGLSSSEAMYKAVGSVGSMLFVGTAIGVNQIDTSKVTFNSTPPNIEITDVVVNQQPLDLSQEHEIAQELSPWQNHIDFKFAALDFSNTELNRFEVKLEGFDSKWQLLRGENLMRYQNLPPGRYKFMVKGSNNHGFFHQHAKEFSFVINPYWWQRLELQILGALLLLGSIYLVYRNRLDHMERINELLQASNLAQEINNQALEQKVADRTSELKSLLDDLARSNAELRKLDQLKDDFIGTVSHELRTPLTSIHGAIKLLAVPQVETNLVMKQQLLSTAEENSNRLVILINDLLDLQKYEKGALEISASSQPILPLIEQAVSSLSTYASKFNVSIVVVADESSASALHFDSNKIRQVLDNLLSNAVKFSKSGSEVKVYSEVVGSYLQVNVEDTGDGIPLEVQPQIFGKFVQANSASNKTVYGSGLGLAISRRIIELHKGEIGFESKPGIGTRFWFRLPID